MRKNIENDLHKMPGQGVPMCPKGCPPLFEDNWMKYSNSIAFLSTFFFNEISLLHLHCVFYVGFLHSRYYEDCRCQSLELIPARFLNPLRMGR